MRTNQQLAEPRDRMLWTDWPRTHKRQCLGTESIPSQAAYRGTMTIPAQMDIRSTAPPDRAAAWTLEGKGLSMVVTPRPPGDETGKRATNLDHERKRLGER
jgi:hypothetical protein